MEQSAATDFNLKEWGLKARTTRENTNFRRFSSSNLKGFREDSTTTISSTVSSPGYTIREEIDPSTYSFTEAIKALQAKSAVCSWEHRLTLHSKWSDAEKYISNPLSGEVPLECLSAKTLSSRSFSSLSNRITVSHLQHFHPIIQHQQHKLNITIQEKKKKKKCTTKDVGIQSTPQGDLSSSSPSSLIHPTTPSIEEKRRKVSVGESSGDSSSPSSEKEKPEAKEVEEGETKTKEKLKEGKGREKKKMMMQGRGRRGCLSFKGLCLWQREKYCNCICKPRKNNNPNPKSSPKFRFQINSC